MSFEFPKPKKEQEQNEGSAVEKHNSFLEKARREIKDMLSSLGVGVLAAEGAIEIIKLISPDAKQFLDNISIRSFLEVATVSGAVPYLSKKFTKPATNELKNKKE